MGNGSVKISNLRQSDAKGVGVNPLTLRNVFGFCVVQRQNLMMQEWPWDHHEGSGSNLSVKLTLCVRITNFDSPLSLGLLLLDASGQLGLAYWSKGEASVRQLSSCPHLSARCPPDVHQLTKPDLSAPVCQMSANWGYPGTNQEPNLTAPLRQMTTNYERHLVHGCPQLADIWRTDVDRWGQVWFLGVLSWWTFGGRWPYTCAYWKPPPTTSGRQGLRK